MKAEVRREMEIAEAQSRTLADRQSTLVEALAASVQRGDLVTVVSGAMKYRGLPRYARGDLLSLQGPAALIECHLSAIDQVVLDASPGERGSAIVHEAESYAARLGLIELSGEEVTVVSVGGARATGIIEAVARDHVVVLATSGHRSYLRLERIAFTIRSL